MSARILLPREMSSFGPAIQARMLGGIQAGSGDISQVSGRFLLKAAKRPLESSSASMEPSFEHRRILSMVTRHPVAAATLPIAVTKVVHSLQRVLYPLRHTATEPELSTQIRTGRFEQVCADADEGSD
jgi:hypothetical protein